MEKKQDEILDVVVVGAGPQALALVSLLHEKKPFALFADTSPEITCKRAQPSKGKVKSTPKIKVVDPHGRWLGSWRSAFKWLEIEHLRSPMTAHPDPRSEQALHEFATAMAFSSKCDICRAGMQARQWNARAGRRLEGRGHHHHHHRGRTLIHDFNESSSYLFDSPSNTAFLSLCDSLIHHYGLDSTLVQGTVTGIRHDGGGEEERDPERVVKGEGVMLVELQDGRRLYAKRLVFCTGYGTPLVPDWAKPFRGALPWGDIDRMADSLES